MKTIIKIKLGLIVLISTISLNAQTPPNPPKTPSVHISEHSDSNTNNSSYSYSHSDSDNKKSNVSVSINNSKDSYSLRAKFPEEKYKEIKEVLINEMNKKNHSALKGKDIWSSDSNGEEVYEVSLSKKKLSMYLDKDIASNSLAEKFKNLGMTIRTVIVGKENEARREAARLQREADKLRRDSERMQREAQRIEREAQRVKTSERYRNDARRFSDEAKRMAQKASRLNTRAGHKGGISSYIIELLGDSKTQFNESQNNSNWTWSTIQKELLNNLKNDELVDSKNDIIFIKDETGFYINGEQLSKNLVTKYNSILTKNKISDTNYFTFYRKNQNIVLVNNNANIEGFLKDLVSNKIIESDNKKVKLELNGTSFYKNNSEIPASKSETLNSILLKNNIIPAPGKIFEIIKPDNYKLGYSIGEKSHIGTWKMKN